MAEPAPPPAPPADPPAPPADPPAGNPPAADPPADPPSPSREDVIRDPQALIDALGSVRDENRRLGRRVKDFERGERDRTEAAKTEIERVTDRATKAEGELAGRDLQILRTEVALEQLLGDDPRVKLAMTLASRLQGTTREEIQTDAAQMRQLLGQGASVAGGQQPHGRVDLGGGSRVDNGTPSGSDAAFNAQLRRAAGRA